MFLGCVAVGSECRSGIPVGTRWAFKPQFRVPSYCAVSIIGALLDTFAASKGRDRTGGTFVRARAIYSGVAKYILYSCSKNFVIFWGERIPPRGRLRKGPDRQNNRKRNDCSPRFFLTQQTPESRLKYGTY